MDPGPIPTLTISAPTSASALAASPVAIFPPQIFTCLNLFFNSLIVIITFFECPCAVSITIRSTFDSNNFSTLSKSFTPHAAPTINFFLLIFKTCSACFLEDIFL